MPSRKRIINMKVLPGEPLNGGGRVCIHLFVQDESGPFVEHHALMATLNDQGQDVVIVKPTRGRLACDPRRGVDPVVKGNVTTITHRTDSPDAVTCLKCKASKEYIERTTTPQQTA